MSHRPSSNTEWSPDRRSVDKLCQHSGSSCSQTGAKRIAAHSFGLNQRGREGSSDAWATQGGSERILTLRLSTSAGMVNIVSIYAPTLCSSTDVKDHFYDDLDAVISRIPASEHLFLLGDFNARVGADYESWPDCLGQHGIGKLNENGQRVLGLCSYRALCIINSYFMTKSCHGVSWKHPRSGHWHQLDLIITRRVNLGSVLISRSYPMHSADCDTDHSLVCSRVRLQPKKLHRNKQKCLPRINTCNTGIPMLAHQFLNTLEEDFSDCMEKGKEKDEDCNSKWNNLRNTIYTAALSTFGKKLRRNPDVQLTTG
ncbi:craniofacial development protein 2-like [Diadema setosum]|uniref:craniofacial development protein 2-like n=1 Tax=Diadema setosum TaxID=31175 RepID=UPI003B3A7686